MLKDYAALCWLELLSFEGFVDVEGVQLQLPCSIYSNFACLHALEPGEALCVVASALELHEGVMTFCSGRVARLVFSR